MVWAGQLNKKMIQHQQKAKKGSVGISSISIDFEQNIEI